MYNIGCELEENQYLMYRFKGGKWHVTRDGYLCDYITSIDTPNMTAKKDDKTFEIEETQIATKDKIEKMLGKVCWQCCQKIMGTILSCPHCSNMYTLPWTLFNHLQSTHSEPFVAKSVRYVYQLCGWVHNDYNYIIEEGIGLPIEDHVIDNNTSYANQHCGDDRYRHRHVDCRMIKGDKLKEDEWIFRGFYTTNDENIVYVDMEPKIVLEPINGCLPKNEIIKTIKKKLSPHITEQIVFSVPHHYTKQPLTRDFNIFVWSSPASDAHGGIDMTSQMWGVSVPCTDHSGIGYWDHGYPIMTPNGHEVAACNEHNLFIYFDLVHENHQNAITIMEHIFDEYIKARNNGFKQDIDDAREIYADKCAVRINKLIDDHKTKMEESKRHIDILRRDLVGSIRDYEMAKKELSNIKQMTKDMGVEKYKKEFDRLIDLAHVVNVHINRRNIVVSTDEIFCVDPRTDIEHFIGTFDITISDRAVSMINTTHKVFGHEDNMNAPHVFKAGNACLGSLGETLPQLIAMHDYPTIIMLCVQFLESVNVEDSAGKKINRWPVSKRWIEANGGPTNIKVAEAIKQVKATPL